MITAVLLVDLLVVVLVGLALCTVLRRPGTPGPLRAGAVAVWLVSAVSLAMLVTAPWGRAAARTTSTR